jgi:anti-sigma factor RsiW
MSCNLAGDLLDKYCDGDVDALERVVVESHISLCPECAAAYAEVQWLSLRLHELGEPTEYPPELFALAAATAEVLTTRPSVPRTLIRVAENSSRFVQFIPGASRAAALARKGMRAAPKAAFDLTSYVVKGGARLAQAII